MKKILISISFKELEKQDLNIRSSMSYEERLNELESIRIQAGQFLYEYPTRFRRIIRVTHKA